MLDPAPPPPLMARAVRRLCANQRCRRVPDRPAFRVALVIGPPVQDEPVVADRPRVDSHRSVGPTRIEDESRSLNEAADIAGSAGVAAESIERVSVLVQLKRHAVAVLLGNSERAIGAPLDAVSCL